MAVEATQKRKYKKNRAPRNSKPLPAMPKQELSFLGSREAFCKRVEHLWNTHSAADIQKIMNSPAKLARMRASDAAIFMRMKQAQTDNGIADMKMLIEYLIGKPAQEINTNSNVTVTIDLAEAARRAAFLLSCSAPAPALPAPAAPITIEQSTAGVLQPAAGE